MSLPHLLLGMLARPASGYDLKRAFDTSLRHLWAAELSQIYPALQRLEQDGLLSSTEKQSENGPARRVYRRTARGTRALHEWLTGDPIEVAVRLPYLGQLSFYGELDDLEATMAFLQTLRDQFERQRTTLRQVEAHWFPDLEHLTDDDLHGHLTLRFGLMRVETSIAWCDECLQRVARRKEHQS